METVPSKVPMIEEQVMFNFGNHSESDFRLWINNQWFEYKEEVWAWEGRNVTGTPQEYFKKYKWFLKAKYKQENINE